MSSVDNLSSCMINGFHPRSEMRLMSRRHMNIPGSEIDDFISDGSISRKQHDLSFPYSYLNDDNSISVMWSSDRNLRYTYIEDFLQNGTIPPWYLGSPIIDGPGISHGPLTREAFIHMASQFYIDPNTGLVIESGSGYILQTSRDLLRNEFIALPSSIRDSTTLQPIQLLRYIEQKTSVWFPDSRRRIQHYMATHQNI
ncbi:hypothetical protein GGX14DRAFT_409155 [Mycena pura]|uniref:Uncharacterized protein n=1 Tax=Mycena pura TaxID=153505 RepID=A0AAD6XX48_9AGAR|nr:hypothetical protein GGX14DRAFT_409155 [Mycena pura]